jgi:hypothetical protein
VFLAAVPVALAAFVLSLFLKEVPLRGTSRAGSSDVGEAFGMPEGTDRAQQLQIAIARLFRKQGREALPAIRAESGTTLEVADAWCVAQVHVRRRLGAESSLAAISRRFRVPAPVLQPAFGAARDNGYLSGTDDDLQLTEQGHEEMHKVIAGTRAWLESELRDWGAADDELLSEALNNLAIQFVNEDAGVRLEPAATN